MPNGNPSRDRATRRSDLLAAAALALLSLATMSGHLSSMDGLHMARQAESIALHGSIPFHDPVWTWYPEPDRNGRYGIGLSLLYVPGMLLAAPLAPLVPTSDVRPARQNEFYLRELYQDPLYTVGGSWVHALVMAAAALMVARLARALGASPKAALWGLAFYGLGSSAGVYARGDFAQPLEALCWVAAFFAAVRLRRGEADVAEAGSGRTSERGLVAGLGTAVAYAIATRPLEGMLLGVAVAALLLPVAAASERSRRGALRAWSPLLATGLGVALGVAVTLAVNHARYGSIWESGYPDDNGWVWPDASRLAGAFVSPARGLLWEFPAITLVPMGALLLWRRGARREVACASFVVVALLANTISWFMWWGGWCWGLRLMGPALPLLAVAAGSATDGLAGRMRVVLPLLLAAGVGWALPGMLTDILGGYGGLADGHAASWKWAAWPPTGAWRFLHHAFPAHALDAQCLDVLWVRLAPATGYWSLLVPALLVLAASLLARKAWHESTREQASA